MAEQLSRSLPDIQVVREMVGEHLKETQWPHYFKLWLVFFPILNVIDVVQTWFFFEHETNWLYLLFPNLIFAIKISWLFFAPLALFVSYPKNPRIVYVTTIALILLYLGIVLVNLFNIVRIAYS
jgi:hypothetical protein